MIIKARNLLDTVAVNTYLSQLESVGAGTVHVKNINSFNANWAIQFGKTNEEQSEIALISASAPSGTTLVLTGTTRFEHPTDTPVYSTKYDQMIFKRSTTGTSGVATPMTDGTVNITPDSLYTQFDDTSGAANYAYKTCYYSSVLLGSSSDSDWLTSAGYDFYSLAKLRQRVKDKLLNPSFIGDDSVIDDWLNEWHEKMTNIVIDVNQDYAIGTADISFSGTTELGTITSADFKQIRKIEYTEDNENWYNANKMTLTEFYHNQTFHYTNPFFYMMGDNVIGRKPADSSGTMRLYYYKINPVLSNETDLLPTPMRMYTQSYVDYALSQAYYKDNKPELATPREASAREAMERFKRELAPRNKTGPLYVVIKESAQEMFSDFF